MSMADHDGEACVPLGELIRTLNGADRCSMSRIRPYDGQPHTEMGVRGATEIKGITFRDLRDCFIRAVMLSTGAETIDGVDMHWMYDEACKGEHAMLCANDLYGFNLDRLDPVAIVQNLCCEVERTMGIFPNVPRIREQARGGEGD